MSKEVVLKRIQAADPDNIWLDRKGAFKMGFSLIWIAMRKPYVCVRKAGTDA